MTCLERVREAIATIRGNLRNLISISEVKALRAELQASNDEKFRITEEMEDFAVEAAMAVVAAEASAEAAEEGSHGDPPGAPGETGPIGFPEPPDAVPAKEGSITGEPGFPGPDWSLWGSEKSARGGGRVVYRRRRKRRSRLPRGTRLAILRRQLRQTLREEGTR